MSFSQHALPCLNHKRENLQQRRPVCLLVSPCLLVDPWSQTGTGQLTEKLGADWQLKSKTWNMLCFSTSRQTTPWGRIVNFNGLFSLETCVCVCECARPWMCLFWSVGALKLQRGCVGWWLHAQLIGQLGYFRATLTSTGGPGSTTYTETHTC